ncbi:MAG: hypothetical protein P8Y65_00420 [Campylobacterales bacterium]
MKKTILITTVFSALLALAGCSEQKKDSDAPTSGAMKCGAGKCGANMVSGNSELAKKQRSILSQMSQDDPRMKCVLGAKTTESLYDCVRDPETGKLTLDFEQ